MGLRYKILNIIREHPGIRQRDLYKHSKNRSYHVLALCSLGYIDRVQDGYTFRLYPRGKVPHSEKPEPQRPFGCWQMNDTLFNKGHGEVFFSALDKAYWLNPIEVPKKHRRQK